MATASWYDLVPAPQWLRTHKESSLKYIKRKKRFPANTYDVIPFLVKTNKQKNSKKQTSITKQNKTALLLYVFIQIHRMVHTPKKEQSLLYTGN